MNRNKLELAAWQIQDPLMWDNKTLSSRLSFFNKVMNFVFQNTVQIERPDRRPDPLSLRLLAVWLWQSYRPTLGFFPRL